jgi:hypothetical protein
VEDTITLAPIARTAQNMGADLDKVLFDPSIAKTGRSTAWGPFSAVSPVQEGWRTKAVLTHSTSMVRRRRGRCQGRHRAAPVVPRTWASSGEGAGRRGWPRSAAADREVCFPLYQSSGPPCVRDCPERGQKVPDEVELCRNCRAALTVHLLGDHMLAAQRLAR